MQAIVYVLRKETRQRPLILSAKNFRFDKPDSALDLSGRHVAVSLSDGGCVEKLQRPSREDPVPTGLERDVSLDQACMLARLLGGAAEVRVTRTGRKSLTTVVTTYIPQYILKPNPASVLS
jgi:hypothetical protein